MKTFIFDLDGTMYRGSAIIESARDFIDLLHEKGIPYLFLTNNAMRTPEENTRYMLDMGYRYIEPWMFFNSAMAAALYTAKMDRPKTACYIGTHALKQALEEQGFVFDWKNPAWCFIGLDKSQDYAGYSSVVPALLNGARLVATNTDRVLVKADGFEIGNGSVAAMFEYCCSQQALKIGKPYAPILELCLEHFHLKKADVFLVGDNLETDIALGYNNDVETIFVQTGVHTEKDLIRYDVKPDHIYRDLSQIVLDDFLC